MTMKNSQNIACMDCKKEGAFEFYGHIDVTTDPTLKVLVKNYELFKFTCPHCGSEQFVNYSFIYQDADHGVLLYHLQSPEEIDQARATLTQDGEPQASADGQYRRLVIGPDALVEKIRIFDAGYDDRVMELYKIFLYGQLRDQLAQAAGGDNVEAVFIDEHLVGSLHFVFVGEGRAIGEIPLSTEVYAQIAADYKDKLDQFAADEVLIDQDWAFDFLGRMAQDA